MFKLCSGSSEVDRIEFGSTKGISAYARFDDNGNIYTEVFKSKKKEKRSVFRKIADFVDVLISCFIIFAEVAFIPNPHGPMEYAHSCLLGCIILVLVYCQIEARVFQKKESLKNHGAEHMVFAAYNDIRKVPTLEEARRYSRISKHCGTMRIGALITYLILCWIIIELTGIYIPIILGILTIERTYKIFPFSILGKYLQLLTTCEPEDRNLKLAIVALRALTIEQ